MRSLLVLPAAALLLAGCAGPILAPLPGVPPVSQAPAQQGNTATRAAAVSVINREMASRLPGVNVVPYTTCVVNNATQAELAELAAHGSNSAAASSAVAAIVTRPAASSCIASISRTA